MAFENPFFSILFRSRGTFQIRNKLTHTGTAANIGHCAVCWQDFTGQPVSVGGVLQPTLQIYITWPSRFRFIFNIFHVLTSHLIFFYMTLTGFMKFSFFGYGSRLPSIQSPPPTLTSASLVAKGETNNVFYKKKKVLEPNTIDEISVRDWTSVGWVLKVLVGLMALGT